MLGNLVLAWGNLGVALMKFRSLWDLKIRCGSKDFRCGTKSRLERCGVKSWLETLKRLKDCRRSLERENKLLSWSSCKLLVLSVYHPKS